MSDQLPTTTVGEVDDVADAFLLDVREPDEYKAGHAPATTHHPLGTLPDAWPTLPSGRTIVCICRSGGRSGQATAFLIEQGLDAINLDGGMQSWAAFGLEVVCDDGSTGTVI